MIWTVIWVGIVTAIAAYLLDYVLWTYVFTEGIGELSSMHADKEKLKSQMPLMLAKSALNTLLFGIVFVMIYARLKDCLWARGVLGGLEFGTILWLPTIALSSIGSNIWLDRIRAAADANFWTWLIKLNVAGVIAALLIR